MARRVGCVALPRTIELDQTVREQAHTPYTRGCEYCLIDFTKVCRTLIHFKNQPIRSINKAA